MKVKDYSPMQKKRYEAYNKGHLWRNLRRDFMMKPENCICSDCKKRGVIRESEEVHHIKPFLINGEINWDLLLDESNLVALCKDCHFLRHHIETAALSAKDLERIYDIERRREEENKKSIEKLNGIEFKDLYKC